MMERLASASCRDPQRSRSRRVTPTRSNRDGDRHILGRDRELVRFHGDWLGLTAVPGEDLAVLEQLGMARNLGWKVACGSRRLTVVFELPTNSPPRREIRVRRVQSDLWWPEEGQFESGRISFWPRRTQGRIMR